MKRSWPDHDTLMESDQMRFIFQHRPPVRFTSFC